MAIESFEYFGYWWPPDNESNCLSGSLEFDLEKGITLKLLGSFEEITALNQMNDYDILLGIANGKIITLYKCYERNKTLQIPGGPKTIINASVIFIGHHFKKIEDLLFYKYSISYAYLADWVRISGFKYKIISDNEQKIKKEELTYEFPNSPVYKINDLKFYFSFTRTTKQDLVSSCHYEQHTFITLESGFDLTFEDFQYKYFGHIQDFLSFAIGSATYPISIVAYSKNYSTKNKDNKIIYPEITIILSHNNPPKPLRKLYRTDFIFSYQDIRAEFERILNLWFKKREILSPVFDLYFSNMYNSKQYLKTQFLNIVQAIESLHRRSFKGKYIQNADFKKYYEELISSIPNSFHSDYKQSLMFRFEHLNEYSLRKRLKDLLRKCKPYKTLLIKDDKVFINNVTNTRNYLTHYDKKLKSESKSDQDLYDLMIQVKFLLELCLLINLGMKTKIDKILNNHHQYQYIASRLG